MRQKEEGEKKKEKVREDNRKREKGEEAEGKLERKVRELKTKRKGQ